MKVEAANINPRRGANLFRARLRSHGVLSYPKIHQIHRQLNWISAKRINPNVALSQMNCLRSANWACLISRQFVVLSDLISVLDQAGSAGIALRRAKGNQAKELAAVYVKKIH
jgi:hypothetical protein